MALETDDYDVQFETDIAYASEYFEALSAMRDEGVLIVSDSSVYTKIQDPANVALAISKIEEEGLVSLEKRSDGLSKAGVNFERLNELFQGTNSTSPVILTFPVKRGSANTMHIDVVDEDIEFYYPLIDTGSVPQPPDMEPIACETQVSVPGTDLKSAINHCTKVESEQNTAVVFSTHSNKFTVSSEDQVKGSVEKTFTASGPASEVDLGDKKTTISLDYLNDVKQTLGASDDVTVHLDNDYPVRLDVVLDNEGNVKIIYVISPRIESK